MNATAILTAALCFSLAASPGEGAVDYVSQVKPLLAAKCAACHGALRQEANLRLDAAPLIKRGGDSGPAIVPGNATASLLVEKVSAEDVDLRMPPEGEGEPLTAEQIALLTRWIDEGAIAPEESIPPPPQSHWAFQPVERPAAAQPRNASWVRNDVDAFLAAKHEEAGLAPAPPVAREVLLRRIYLDLVGLPPTRSELHAFLADDSPQAYERVVDRLLDSPQYGERWGRHWMDVWRYSDWAGFGGEIRYSQRHIWRWRDWIIQSLNADKGYDRMILEMLAADELAPGDDDALRATGFLARNWYKFDRHVWLDDTIEHTGKAFLGMTFKCARCHDHKYDPVSQTEYYRLRAIFEPYDVRTDQVPGELDVAQDGMARVYDAHQDAPTFLFRRGDPKQPDKDRPLAAGVPAVLRGELSIEPIALPLEGYYPAMREFVSPEMTAQAQAAVAAADAELAAAHKHLASIADVPEVPPQQQQASSPRSLDVAASSAAAVFVDDDFTQRRDEVWKPVRGQWEYVEGHLVQKEIVGAFSPLATVKDHPRDFSAALKFKPTGGNVYRSVGLSFDWVEDRDFQAVYLSAKDGGSTVSAFHRRDGRDVYPPAAIVPHAIKVGQEATLEVLVRGDVLNLKVDGQLKLAYRLSAARQPGKFAIWTYDASAEFDHVRVAELPAEIQLAPPSAELTAKSQPEGAALTREGAAQVVALAEKKLATAKAQVAAVEARVAAERAKYAAEKDADSSTKEQLAKAAAKAERLAALAAADEHLLAAQQQLLHAQQAAAKTGDDKTRQALDAAEKKLAEAQKAHDSAKAAAAQESTSYQPLGPTYPAASTGRRLALARWIADRRNPLTARVAVNHIWLRHFGRPLVENVDDFGLRSPRPPLADLLDYLAVELMDNRWSTRHVHRLIVTSNAYRMSSSAHRDGLDRDNRLFWKMNPHRMEAETVRDALLHVGGNLDLARGGPDIDHEQGFNVPRRSLYFRHARERQMEFLRMFDPANPRECYRRMESIRPQQALALVNSSLALAQSRRLAAQLVKELASKEGKGEGAVEADTFVAAAFETLLSRSPSGEELKACREFLAVQAQQLADPAELELLGNAADEVPPSPDPAQRARENLVLVLFNHNDFVTVR